MKKLIVTSLALVFCSMAWAQVVEYEVVATWSANPTEQQVTAYRVYVDGDQVGEVTGLEWVNLAAAFGPGDHELVVRAVNARGEGAQGTPIPFSLTPEQGLDLPGAVQGVGVTVRQRVAE